MADWNGKVKMLERLKTNSQYQLEKSVNSNRTIGSTKQQIIDSLLNTCSDLIDYNYKKWFAKKFQALEPTTVMELASQARQDGSDPKRLFCFLIRKHDPQI